MLICTLSSWRILQNVLISGNAYVAGWGQVSNSECHTGLNGPSPFTQCNFPFKWKDKVLISMKNYIQWYVFRRFVNNILKLYLLYVLFQIYFNCTKDPTPSASNPDCMELLESLDDMNLKTSGARIRLVIENQSSKRNKIKKKQFKRNSTACYTNLDQHRGWCATHDMDSLTMDTSLNNRAKNDVSKWCLFNDNKGIWLYIPIF